MNADAEGYVLEDSPDDIRARMTEFYREWFEERVAQFAASCGVSITPEQLARVVAQGMALPAVQDEIESFVARHTGGLH